MNFLLTALRAVAEQTRLRLLALCAEGELSVSEIARILGQSQPRVSRHLKVLTDAGLLQRVQEGSWVFHRLVADGPGLPIARRLITLLPEADRTLVQDRESLARAKEARARAAQRYFRRNAAGWDRLRALHVDEDEVERVIRGLLPTDGEEELLDVGTGTGRMLEVFGPGVRRAQGIDMSVEMLAVARSNLDRAGLGNCQVRQADLFQLPFSEGRFDAVTCHQVLHFVDDPARAIAESARVLKPGGRMLVVDFAPHDQEDLRRDHEHRRLGFGDDEVSAWFAASHLATRDVVHLPGDPLTVTVWLGTKEAGP
jgi:ArsR family transcriptional regulator